MQPVPLDSSLLVWASYDPETQQLDLELQDGKRYRYFPVPSDCFQQLLNAESKGRYFNRSIRNLFSYQRLTGTDRHTAIKTK